jgi:hypothetical protein
MSAITFANLISTITAATDEEMATLSLLLKERCGFTEAKAVVAAAEKEPKAKKEPKEPKETKPKKEAPPLPSAEDGVPDASEYRVPEADIDDSVCVGREFVDKDTRWSPAVLREKQCGGKLVDGSDLCKKCTKRQEKYAENPTTKSPWTGRVTEEPLKWVHMLGTEWAEEKKPTFTASGSSGSSATSVADDAASESEASEQMEAPAAKKEPKAKKAPVDKEAKAAAAEAKKAATEAAKEAKKAEAEAAKEAKKAAAEAAKEAKKAEAEAAKAKKAAEKPAPKAKAAPKPKKESAKPKEEVVAAAAEPTEVTDAIKNIGGVMYVIKNGNCYDYDMDTEGAGDYCGRLVGEGEDLSIDGDAAEVVA